MNTTPTEDMKETVMRRNCIKLLVDKWTISRFDFNDIGLFGAGIKDAIDSLSKIGIVLGRLDSGGNPTWEVIKFDQELFVQWERNHLTT